MHDYWHLFLGALFLRRESYEYQRDRTRPFAHGLTFVVIIGLLVAVAGILGAGLRYASLPNSDAIQNIVLKHLQAMPFYGDMTTAAQAQFLSTYNQIWNNFGGAFFGYPTTSAGLAQLLVTIVTTPLSLVVGWLVYSVLVHLVARGVNKQVSLAEGMGTLALATSPQLLTVLDVFPGVMATSAVITLWSLILSTFAVRTTYRTSTGRAIFAALFPLLLFLIPAFLLLCCGLFALAGAAGGRR